MDKRELHIIMHESNDNRIINSYNGTKCILDYIENKKNRVYKANDIRVVYTSQIVFANTKYLQLGMDMYLHIRSGEEPLQLIIGKNLYPYSNIVLNPSTNICNLILSGEFNSNIKK